MICLRCSALEVGTLAKVSVCDCEGAERSALSGSCVSTREVNDEDDGILAG